MVIMRLLVENNIGINSFMRNNFAKQNLQIICYQCALLVRAVFTVCNDS